MSLTLSLINSIIFNYLTPIFGFLIWKRIWLSLLSTILTELLVTLVLNTYTLWSWYIFIIWPLSILTMLFLNFFCGDFNNNQSLNKNWSLLGHEFTLPPGWRHEVDYWNPIEIGSLFVYVLFYGAGFSLIEKTLIYNQFPIGFLQLIIYHSIVISFVLAVNWKSRIIQDYWNNQYKHHDYTWIIFHLSSSIFIMIWFFIALYSI